MCSINALKNCVGVTVASMAWGHDGIGQICDTSQTSTHVRWLMPRIVRNVGKSIVARGDD